MNTKTVTRMDFIELFTRQFFLSHTQSCELTEIILEEIYQGIAQNNLLKISSFGTFVVRNKAPRMGRNPKTGQEALITARKTLSFRPSQLLKKRINRPLTPTLRYR